MAIFASTTRALITWALLPVALLSGMPLAVCICASGEQKLFCQRIYGGRKQDSAATPRACCLGGSEVAVAKTTSRSCCHAQATPTDDVCGTAVTGHCCTSSVELPSPRVPTERLVLSQENEVVALLPPTSGIPPGLSRADVSRVASQGSIPPPDLLVLHCTLLI